MKEFEINRALISQRELWEKQHASRGESHYEGTEMRSTPNEAAIILADHLSPASNIMEVGSANGRDARYWAQKGHHVVALDFSPIAIQQLQSIAREQGVSERINLTEWDVSEGFLPKQDMLMDAFYARSSLQIDDVTMTRLAVSINSILTPSGLIMIEGKAPSDKKIARSRIIEGNLAIDPYENGHLRRVWTKTFTEDLCEKVGWDIVELNHTEQVWEDKPTSFMRVMAKKINYDSNT